MGSLQNTVIPEKFFCTPEASVSGFIREVFSRDSLKKNNLQYMTIIAHTRILSVRKEDGV